MTTTFILYKIINGNTGNDYKCKVFLSTVLKPKYHYLMKQGDNKYLADG